MKAKTNLIKPLLKVSFAIVLAGLIAGCAKNNVGSGSSGATVSQSVCAGNHYLEKYGCSLDRVEAAAQNGDPDAQYALGYMYYYGIGTVRDVPTARLWIKRAAAQDQPLAKKALKMIDSGGNLRSLHHANRSSGGGGRSYPVVDDTSIKEMNTATPTKPLKEVLPAYGKKRSSSSDSSIAPPPLSNTGESSSSSNPAGMPSSHLNKPKQIHDPRLSKSATPVDGTKTAMVSAAIGRSAISTMEASLLEVPAQHYTLQLMGGYDLAAIKSFVAKNNISDEAKYYEAQFHGKSWYMLVYGDYDTVMQAHAASQHLPAALRSMKPWVKSFRNVQKEIKTRQIV